MSEVLLNFIASPAQAPEIRQGTTSLEMRLGEVPTPGIAANDKQSAIELRITSLGAEYAWSLMECWPEQENVVAGGFGVTLTETFNQAVQAFEEARKRRNLPNRGYAWAILDLWTCITRVMKEAHVTRDEHVLKGEAGYGTLRGAFEAALPSFQQFNAMQRG